jgi:hypothetical protein
MSPGHSSRCARRCEFQGGRPPATPSGHCDRRWACVM